MEAGLGRRGFYSAEAFTVSWDSGESEAQAAVDNKKSQYSVT